MLGLIESIIKRIKLKEDQRIIYEEKQEAKAHATDIYCLRNIDENSKSLEN